MIRCTSLGLLALLHLAVGLAATGAPARAQAPTALSETYSDWIVRCQTLNESERRCWMVQTLQQEQDGQRILQLEFVIRDGETFMALLAPFGLLLSEGVDLVIDDGFTETVPFRTCLPAGCLVEMEPSDALLGALRAGNVLNVRFTIAATEEPLRLEMSLSGFTAAHNRLRALSNAQAQ